MRRGLVVAGAVVLVAGLLLFAFSMAVTTTVSIPVFPQEQVLQGIHAFGSATMQVHWNGGVAASVVHVFRCTLANCSTGGDEVGNATGAAGTMAVGVVGGASYALSVTGPPAKVSASINLIGITPIGLVGFVVLLVGVGFLVVAFRKSRTPSATRPSPPATPP